MSITITGELGLFIWKILHIWTLSENLMVTYEQSMWACEDKKHHDVTSPFGSERLLLQHWQIWHNKYHMRPDTKYLIFKSQHPHCERNKKMSKKIEKYFWYFHVGNHRILCPYANVSLNVGLSWMPPPPVHPHPPTSSIHLWYWRWGSGTPKWRRKKTPHAISSLHKIN